MADLQNSHIENYDKKYDAEDLRKANLETRESLEQLRLDIDKRLDHLLKNSKGILNFKEARLALEKTETREKILDKLAEKERNNGTKKLKDSEIIKVVHEEAIKIRTVNLAKEKMSKKIDEKLGWIGKIPLIGDSIKNFFSDSIKYNIDKYTLTEEQFEKIHKNDNFFTKVTGWALNFFLGFDKDFLKIKDNLSKASLAVTGTGAAALGATEIIKNKSGTAIKEGVEKGVDKVVEKGKGKIENEKNVNKNKENEKKVIDVIDKEKIPLRIGAKMLLFLSGINENNNSNNNNYTPIYDKLSKMNFSQIKELYLDENKKESFVKKYENENIDKTALDNILNAFFDKENSDTPKYLNISMKYDHLKNVLKPNDKYNESLIKYGISKARIDEIIKLSKSNKSNFDWWEKLTFNEISIIHFCSYGALGLLSIGGAKEAFKTMGNDIVGFLNDGVDLSDITESANDILPKKVIEAIAKNNNINGVQAINNKNFEELILKNYGEKFSDNEKEKLHDLIEFKEYIVEKFIKNKKINLNPDEQKLFRENLSYKYVIGLYGIMGGIRNVDNLNPINLLSTILLTSKVLGTGGMFNGMESTGYLKRCILDALDDDNSRFTKDEKEIFGIYKDRFFGTVVKAKLTHFLKILGIGKDNLGQIALGLGLTGVASLSAKSYLLKTAGTLSKSGRVVGMSGLRLGGARVFGIVGWLSLLGGAIAAGAYFYGEKVKTEKQDEAFKRMIDSNNIEEAIKFFKELETAISTINVPGSNKKMIVVQWPGDTTLVYFNGKMYTPKILKETTSVKDVLNFKGDFIKKDDSNITGYNITDKTEKLGTSIWGAIKQTVGNMFKSEETGKVNINGELIDLTKTKIKNGKIILGDNEKEITIPLEKIANEISDSSNYKAKQDIISDMAEDLNETFRDDVFDGENESIFKEYVKKKHYIEIKKLHTSNDNITKKSFVLLEVGDLKNIGKKAD